MNTQKLEVILSIAIVAALITLGLSLAFYSQLLMLFGVLLLTVQALSLTLVVAGGVWLAWFSGDRSIALLLRLEELRQAKETTEQMRAQGLVIHSQAALNHAQVIASSTIIKEVTQNKALFMLHQGETHFIPALTQPNAPMMLQAPNDAMTQLPDLMTQLDECDSVLIVAKKGAGKSELLRRMIDKRTGVSVLDPHASPQQWGVHQVIGAGLDFDAIHSMLHETTEAERRNRYKQLEQGVTQFTERTFCFDEMTEVTSEIDVAKPVQRLLNCRKVNMKVVMGGHSMNAPDLGLSGKFNLLKNFDAVVKIDYNKATGVRRYMLCLQPTGHYDEFVECANPGLYVPMDNVVPKSPPVPVVSGDGNAVPDAVPVSSPPVPVPNAVPTISPQERMTEQVKLMYKERDLEIALCIIQGMNKTATRDKVGGKNETTGKRYDEIQAELQPVYFNIKDLKTGGEQS